MSGGLAGLMGGGAGDLAAVADEEFAQGLERAARGEGETATREGFVRIHSIWRATVGGDGIGDVDLREMAASRLLAYRLTWVVTDERGEPGEPDDQGEPEAPTPEPKDDVDSPSSGCSAAMDLAAMSPMGQQKQRQTAESEPWPTLWGRLVALGWRQETRVREGGREDHYYIPPHRREGSPRRLDSRVKVRRYILDGTVYASGTPKPATSGRPAAAPQVLALPLPRQLPAGPKKSRQRQLSQQQVRSSRPPPTPLTASAAAAHSRDPGTIHTSRCASAHGTDVDLADSAGCVKRRRLTSEQAEEPEAKSFVRSLAGFQQSKCHGDARSHYDLTGNDDYPGAESLVDAPLPEPPAAPGFVDGLVQPAKQVTGSFDMSVTTVRHDTSCHEASARSFRPPFATDDKSTVAGATDRMIAHPQLQSHDHGTASLASQAQASPTTARPAPTANLAPSPIKPSRRSRKPPPRWCEDPLATAELGGSAAKLLELELQRRQSQE